MNAREKCTRLVSKLYAGITMRDGMLNEGITRHVRSGDYILDAGCGRDAPIAARHASEAALTLGVDMVRKFDTPPAVHLICGDLNTLPFPSETFDLIFSRSVLEHLHQPRQTLLELSRILKEKGRLIMVTPNKYDYASLVARIIPDRLHGVFLRTTAGEDVYDNFPTYFRCNTQGAIRKAIQDTHLSLKKLVYVRHYPYYFMFSLPLFYLGVAYDRLITRLKMDFLQPSIYVELVKS